MTAEDSEVSPAVVATLLFAPLRSCLKGITRSGQLDSGKKFWPDQTPVAVQQFEYEFDHIGHIKPQRL